MLVDFLCYHIQFYINVQNNTQYAYTGYEDGKEVSVGVKELLTAKETFVTGDDYEDQTTVYAGEDYASGGVSTTRPSYGSDLHARKDGSFLQNEAVSLSKTPRRIGYWVLATHPQTTRITDAISIYLPPNVQDNTLMNYTPAETAMLGYLAASGGAALEAIRANDMRALT